MQVSGFRIYFLEPGYFFSKILSEFRKKIVALHSPSAVNALEQEAPEGYVYVQVTTGVSDDSYIEVTSGLQEGDTVAYLRTASSGSGNMMMGGMPSDMGGGMGGGMPSGGMPSGGPGGGF